MVGCIPGVPTILLTPILTYIHMVYVRATDMSYMSFMRYMTSVILHAYILQYGCQKTKNLTFAFVFYPSNTHTIISVALPVIFIVVMVLTLSTHFEFSDNRRVDLRLIFILKLFNI